MIATRDLLDLKVSITGGVHLDLVKRVLRDLDRSGQDADEIITQVICSHFSVRFKMKYW